MRRFVPLLLLFICSYTQADTPPARTIFSQTYDGTGTYPINSTPISGSNALDVDILGTLPSATGRTFVTSARNVYSSTNVTTGSWVTLVSSLSAPVNEICVFDSSGQTLQLGTGSSPSASVLIFPGGNGCMLVTYASGTRISIEAVSATASVGELDINFME